MTMPAVVQAPTTPDDHGSSRRSGRSFSRRSVIDRLPARHPITVAIVLRTTAHASLSLTVRTGSVGPKVPTGSLPGTCSNRVAVTSETEAPRESIALSDRSWIRGTPSLSSVVGVKRRPTRRPVRTRDRGGVAQGIPPRPIPTRAIAATPTRATVAAETAAARIPVPALRGAAIPVLVIRVLENATTTELPQRRPG